MKKYMFLLVLLLLPIMVYAEDVQTLIPVGTKASVKTENFDYRNFVYNTSVDDKGNGLITFESIKNNGVTKKPISINVLLFGEDQKNIGFVTYCTDRDLDSNYSGYKLNGNSSAPFSIKVVSKYFIEGKTAKDVKYISVYDDNKYCQIGGYDKYKDLTLDEIVNGATLKKDVNGITRLITELQEKGLMPLVILVLVSIAVFVIIIMIISVVVKKTKNARYTKVKEVDTTPIEETVDLSYGEVDNTNIESDSSVSMGDENTLEDDVNVPLEKIEDPLEKEVVNDEEEDGSDLTSFFN